MAKYKLETQLNTSQHFLILGDGIAEEFSIGCFTFKIAKKDFDKRAGFRYFVSCDIEADSRNDAYGKFLEKLFRVADSMAFFYSQPVNVEYWNILIRKDAEKAAYLSCHRLRPTTSMRDYSLISDELFKIIDAVNDDDEIYNIVWLYNNAAKLDGVDFDPGSSQVALCQLVESLAKKEDSPMCEYCQQGGYKKTSRKSIKEILGKDLYEKLYGGENILRNRLSHGLLTGGAFLSGNDVEDIILKVSNYVNDKYKLRNKVTSSMLDRIRATNSWTGFATTVNHDENGLEHFLEQFELETLKHVPSLPKNW